MFEVLSRWLVQQPAHILLVAAANLALWAVLRITVLRVRSKGRAILVAAGLWLLYAIWEWLVLVRSPEADIRVDLLLILPVLGLATLWAYVRSARDWWASSRKGR